LICPSHKIDCISRSLTHYGNGSWNRLEPEKENGSVCDDCVVWGGEFELWVSVSIGDHLKCINGNIRIIGSIHESKIPHLSSPNAPVRKATLSSGKSAKDFCCEYVVNVKTEITRQIPNPLQIRVVLFVFIVIGCMIKYMCNAQLLIVR
jgi:hypothetical protein